jgi:hypothetical protein
MEKKERERKLIIIRVQVSLKCVLRYFAFWTIHFLKVNEKSTNAFIIQYIGTQYSPTCFGTLKYHHQGVKHDPATSHDIGHLSQQDHV